jgi:hypothetical protein
MVNFFSKLNQRFPKRRFDVNNKEDLRAYKNFLANRSWGNNGCPFECEWPWLNIPDMIAFKIAENVVSKV